MIKYKITCTVRGAIHRPAYTGTVEIATDNPDDIQRAVYTKLKNSAFFDIDPGDVRITRKELV